MFTELMPLIEGRPLTITVAALSGGRIRVNVVPQKLGKDSKVNDKIGYSNKDKIANIPESAINALTTPLSLTGTPAEIDAELAQQLRNFVESYVGLQGSVDQARQEIAEAVKAIEERDKNRSKTRTATASKPDDKSQETKPAADSPSLFDPQATPTGQPSVL